MSSKARTLVKGSIMGTVNFFASAIIGILMMPFIIHSLGDRMYGLWIIVGSFLGFYGLFNLGLIPAIQRYISRAIGKEDWEEANKIINTSLFLFTILGLIALLITIIIIIVASHFIKNSAEVAIFKQVIFILGLHVALAFPMRVFSGVLVSNVRYDLYTFVEMVKLIIRTLLVIIFLKIGYGILVLALITAVVEILGYITKMILVKTMYKYITLSRKFINFNLIKSLFKYSSISFIIEVAGELGSKASNFVIASFMGLPFVTLYAVASNLIRYFMRFVTSSVGLMMPVFSQYEGKGDYVSIREKYILSVKISSYLSIFVGASLMLFGKPFIQRWMGESYSSAYPLLVVLVIPMTFFLMQRPSTELLYGISKHKFLAVITTFIGISKLILSIALVGKFGLMGVAMGSAIPNAIIYVFIQPLYICKAIKIEAYEFYFKVIIPIVVKSLFVLAAFWLLFKRFILPSYSNLLTLSICEGLLFLVVIFHIGFNDSEKSKFKKIFSR